MLADGSGKAPKRRKGRANVTADQTSAAMCASGDADLCQWLEEAAAGERLLSLY